MRVGQGFDIHAFSADEARPLMLGLIEIPGHRGLEGHSDADVATHAVIDAMLGAVGAGDIGELFSDNDPSIKNIASRDMLLKALDVVEQRGFQLVNVDLTVVAEVPRLGPHKTAMAQSLSQLVGCDVSVKATTMEGLGPIGAKNAIAAMAVCLVEEKS